MASIKKIFSLEAALFLLCTIVYIIGIVAIDVMDVDSSQYASMSWEVFMKGDYLQLTHRGENYLDKPPLLFWLGALFFKLFGVSHIAFRLPSFLFTILGTYSTYKLGVLLYNKKTGIIAALALYSSQAYFLFNHDVRTDCILANSVVFAVWQLWKYIRENKIINFVLGFIGVALAMLAKGPIGLLAPAFAIGCDLLLKKDFKRIFQLKWLGGLAIVLIILSPMVYGLYKQYGIEGPRFYFWTQSFGRITGESTWQNDSSAFYFVHIFLWSFLPWSFLFIAALFKKIKTLVKDKFVVADETVTLGGFLITFIALSLSRYKLPHYIFITYPFAAIITAAYLVENIDVRETRNLFFRKFMRPLQWFIGIVLLLSPLVILLFVFPGADWWIWMLYIFLLLVILALVLKKFFEEKIIYFSLIGIATANLILNIYFYPNLLNYQSGSVAARFLNEAGVPKEEVYWFKVDAQFAFDFYLQHYAPYLPDITFVERELMEKKEIWLFTNSEGMDMIKQQKMKITFVKTIPHQQAALLTIPFLNPVTREKALRNFYLVKLKANW